MIIPKINILDYIYENQDWLEEAFMVSYDLLTFMDEENYTLQDISIKTGLNIEVLDSIINQASRIDKEILQKIESAHGTKIFLFDEDLVDENFEYNLDKNLIELPNISIGIPEKYIKNNKNNSQLRFPKINFSNHPISFNERQVIRPVNLAI